MSNVLAGRQGKSLAVHFSSKTDNWATPDWLFESLNHEFGFTLDACASPENAKCRRFFSKAENGLTQFWENETVFMNPPYGREIGKWVRKAFESTRDGSITVCLLPARTDTSWWHSYVMRGEIRLIRGRLKFGKSESSAPFPSAVVIFRPRTFRLVGFHCVSKGTLKSEDM